MTSTRHASPLLDIKNPNKTKDVPNAIVPAGNPWYLEVPESNVVELGGFEPPSISLFRTVLHV
jgi:hypothetical protein